MSRAELVNDLVVLGARLGNEDERTPFTLASRCWANNETGLLALVVGCANWGVSWTDYPGAVPDDPAGLDWAGPPKRKGKHWIDGGRERPWGGVGICHADSSFLRRDCYGRWERPAGIPDDILDRYSFDRILGSTYRGAWLDWSTPLLARPEFHLWLTAEWLKAYWTPAVKTFPYCVESQAINARVSNSVKGVGKRLREGLVYRCTGKPGERRGEYEDLRRLPSPAEQIDGYCEYKRASRGQRQADRAHRQAMQARRVAVVVDAMKTAGIQSL